MLAFFKKKSNQGQELCQAFQNEQQSTRTSKGGRHPTCKYTTRLDTYSTGPLAYGNAICIFELQSLFDTYRYSTGPLAYDNAICIFELQSLFDGPLHV